MLNAEDCHFSVPIGLSSTFFTSLEINCIQFPSLLDFPVSDYVDPVVCPVIGPQFPIKGGVSAFVSLVKALHLP